MKQKINPDIVCSISEDVVARNIEGEMLIVPLTKGIGDMEDALYTLNKTGMAIWACIDGKKKIKDIVAELSEKFEASSSELEQDVFGFADELLKRGILIESSKH